MFQNEVSTCLMHTFIKRHMWITGLATFITSVLLLQKTGLRIPVHLILEPSSNVSYISYTTAYKDNRVGILKIVSIREHREDIIDVVPNRTCVKAAGKVSVHFKGRLGNKMFQYASLYGIAHSSCRTPVASFKGSKSLQHMFSGLSVAFKVLPKVTVVKELSSGRFSPDLVAKSSRPEIARVGLDGYLQSYKYFAPFEGALRKQFQLSPRLGQQADVFLNKVGLQMLGNQTGASKQAGTNITFVGVHQRRGDLLARKTFTHGYRTADRNYFQRALQYYRTKYHNTHFIVAGDDLHWMRTNIKGPDVTFTQQESDLDFAILTRCNHSVISVGTFGWWAAWLAGGEVVYFRGAFGEGSLLQSRVNPQDYYPPHWKVM